MATPQELGLTKEPAGEKITEITEVWPPMRPVKEAPEHGEVVLIALVSPNELELDSFPGFAVAVYSSVFEEDLVWREYDCDRYFPSDDVVGWWPLPHKEAMQMGKERLEILASIRAARRRAREHDLYL